MSAVQHIPRFPLARDSGAFGEVEQSRLDCGESFGEGGVEGFRRETDMLDCHGMAESELAESNSMISPGVKAPGRRLSAQGRPG